jgi:hypothetical protein
MMRASPQGATMPLGPLPPSPVPNRRAQERERAASDATDRIDQDVRWVKVKNPNAPAEMRVIEG